MTDRMCGTCYYSNDSKDIGRCFYCKSVYDDTGDWCEWETDYIGRMEAIENVIDQLRVSSSKECLRERLLNLRPADVRPVARGKWEYDHWCEFKCSSCGAWSKSEPYRGQENFCPNCGADMRSTNFTKTATADEEREVLNVRAWLNNGADMREEQT